MRPQEYKCHLQDPLHSKPHLADFSYGGIRKSQIKTRQLQKDDQLYCELCMKLYKLDEFKNHLQQHRRIPQPKIPQFSFFCNFDNKRQIKEVPEKTIDSLLSQDGIGLDPISRSFGPISGNQLRKQREFIALSPQKPTLRFYANNLTLTRSFNEELFHSLVERSPSQSKRQEGSPGNL